MLIIVGVAMILIGTILWLYADYSGSTRPLMWSGASLVLIGMLVWIYGDNLGHLI